MEKIYKFTCNECWNVWREDDAEFGGVEAIHLTADKLSDYQQGFHCPKCESKDVSGEEIK